jgi:hypothetical protein
VPVFITVTRAAVFPPLGKDLPLSGEELPELLEDPGVYSGLDAALSSGTDDDSRTRGEGHALSRP